MTILYTEAQAFRQPKAWLHGSNLRCSKQKAARHVLTEELVCCRHNLKEKSVLSDHNSWWFLLLFDDIYDSMIIMILFIMDIILNI